MELFSIHCATCQATLKVRSAAAIGQILACPKCDSMVLVAAPPGWTPAEQHPVQATPAPLPPVTEAVSHTIPPPLPEGAVASISSAEQPPLPAGPAWASPTEQLGQKVLLWAAVAGAGLFVVGAVTGYLWSRRDAGPPALPVVAQASAASPQREADPAPPPAKTAPLKAEPALPAAKPITAQKVEPAPAPPEDPLPEESPPAAPPAVTEIAAVDTKSLPPSENSPPPAPVATRTPVVVERRAPPPDASLAIARLEDKLPQIELRGVPLMDFIDFMSDMTMLPITLDLPAMTRAGVTLRDAVSVRKIDATVGESFTEALAGLGLAYVVEDGQVVITADVPVTTKVIKHPVNDLLEAGPEAMGRFAQLLEKLVAPESWRSAGGQGTLRIEGGNLAIDQTPAVHDELIVFCEKLRVARGRPLRSKFPPEQFRLETRAARAADKLKQSVTFTFHQPTRLAEVVRYLGKLTDTTILVDWRSLARREFGPGTEISCAIEGQTLQDALSALAESLELAWRAVDQRTIEIFSAGEPNKLEWEFYPLAALVEAGIEPDALLTELRRATLVDSSREAAGQGRLYFDAASKYLLARHAGPVQAQLQRILAARQNSLPQKASITRPAD